MPGSADIIAAQLTQRRLNSRDKALQQQLQNAPDDLPMEELSPGNIAQLMEALQNARHPLERATLQAELDRLRSLAENLQPMAKGVSPVMRLPYNGDQPPELQGGFRLPQGSM